jgi:hypothetical protein
MEHSHRIRTAGMSCVAGVVLWIIALLTEYGFGLQSADSGTFFSSTNRQTQPATA